MSYFNPTPEEILDRKQRIAIANGFLAKLTEKERYVVTRHWFRHMTFREIAGQLDVSTGRVSQLAGIAVHKMQKWAKVSPFPRSEWGSWRQPKKEPPALALTILPSTIRKISRESFTEVAEAGYGWVPVSIPELGITVLAPR